MSYNPIIPKMLINLAKNKNKFGIKYKIIKNRFKESKMKCKNYQKLKYHQISIKFKIILNQPKMKLVNFKIIKINL